MLIADDEVGNRAFVARILSNAHWVVVEAINGEETIAVANAALPDLIIMDIGMPSGGGAATTHRIRALPTPLASVPILASTTLPLDDAEIFAIGMDGHLPKPCTPKLLEETVAQWRPDGEMDGAYRLVETFGAAELAPLLTTFREQLAEAVERLDAGDVTAAHQIAGIAGTLGFAAVSASWMLVSQGRVPSHGQARREARIAIAQIDRDSLAGGALDTGA